MCFIVAISFHPTGAVPAPESLLSRESTPRLTPFQPVKTEDLMASVTPTTLAGLQQMCQGSMQCVHDILSTDDNNLGLQSLQDQKEVRKLALTYGEKIFQYDNCKWKYIQNVH